MVRTQECTLPLARELPYSRVSIGTPYPMQRPQRSVRLPIVPTVMIHQTARGDPHGL